MKILASVKSVMLKVIENIIFIDKFSEANSYYQKTWHRRLKQMALDSAMAKLDISIEIRRSA